MLNYLSAELWRMTRRRSNLVGWGAYLVLVALVALLWSWGDLALAMEALRDLLVVGLYLCAPLAAEANGGALRTGTLGNEMSWGLSRRRIYLGKLLAGLIAGVVLFLATTAVFLAASLLAGGGATGGEDLPLRAARLWEGIMVALPRYFGALGLAHLLCFTLRTGGLAATVYYVYISFVEGFLSAVQAVHLGLFGDLLNALSRVTGPVLLSIPFFNINSAPATAAAQSWLVGLGWLALTTALGMLLFRRREIR